MSEFIYTGNNKTAFDLSIGDFVTLTGCIDEVAEIEEVYPVGPKEVAIQTADGAGKIVNGAKLFRLYE